MILCVKVRLNILPTNFTVSIWNHENNPRCPFCNHSIESMAHLFNGCHREFGNFYSKQQKRTVNHLFERLKSVDKRFKNYNNENIETILSKHEEILLLRDCRKPNIVLYDQITTNIDIIEVTICYDFYFEQAQNSTNEN